VNPVVPIAFPIRQGDRLPRFGTTAADAGGPIDFTRFLQIEFHMTSADGVRTISGPATGDAAGNLGYDWNVGDTDYPGMQVGIFRAWDVNGKSQSFPTVDGLPIYVVPRPERGG
jgi:hypothetical protein